MDSWRALPVYSDRIAQDFHLIPFSRPGLWPVEHLLPYMELYIDILALSPIPVKANLFFSHHLHDILITPDDFLVILPLMGNHTLTTVLSSLLRVAEIASAVLSKDI